MTDQLASIEYDHHSKEYAETAPELHRQLRNAAPVARSESHGGFWVVTRHHDVVEASRADGLFSNAHDLTGDPEMASFQGVAIPPPPVRMIPIEVDPPEFNAYRRLLNPAFSPGAVATWDTYLRDLVTACIDTHIESGSMDFVLDLANPVPAITTLAVLGMPVDNWDRFAEPMHTAVYAPPGTPAYDQAALDQFWIVEQLMEAVEARRSAPNGDLLSELANGTLEDGSAVSPDDAVAMAYTIMAGGVDTTTALMSNAIVWLDQNPEVRLRLVRQPELIPLAREEFLRYFSPVQAFARTVTETTSVQGCPMHRGDRALLSFASANRDETVFEDPEVLDIERTPNRHVSFGAGIHRCLGRHFARHEIDLVLGEILRRMPDYTVDHGRVERYESIGNINGLVKVPISFPPGEREGSPMQSLIEP